MKRRSRTKKPTLYEQAATVAIWLGTMLRDEEYTPEDILATGKPNLIRIVYERVCRNV